MRNAIQYRILQGLHQQISGTLAQETLDANEDVVLAGEMLGQLFLILKIKLADHSLINITELRTNLSLAQKQGTFFQFCPN